jgi:hypothetical protein
MGNVHVVPLSRLAERIGCLEAGREAEVKRAIWLRARLG